MMMTCEAANPRLTEAARRRAGMLDAELQKHLDGCAACAARWQEQRDLSATLRIMRIQSAGERSPEQARSLLMKQFDSHHGQPARSRRWLRSARAADGGTDRTRNPRRGWTVRVFLRSLQAAAAALIAAVAIHEFRTPPAPVEIVADAESEAREEGFIDVPFAPPLAPGELVRVVHTALQPAALASMGVNVDPTWTTELPADLLVGEDGFPRAVRVSNEGSSETADSGS